MAKDLNTALHKNTPMQNRHFQESTENMQLGDSNIVYESPSSQILRSRLTPQDAKYIDFVAGSQIYHPEVAIKSLTSPNPSHEDLSFLNNEYHILTRYLSNSNSSVRRALGRTVAKPACKDSIREAGANIPQSPETRHAIYFEWVDGISLEDLVKKWQERKKANKSIASESDKSSPTIQSIFAVQLMHKIAVSLAEVHDAGVIHNDIALDNIIVNINAFDDVEDDKTNESNLHSVSATIIDFGYASTVAMAETNDTGETVNDDLYNLGVIYREILLATYPPDSVRNSLRRSSLSRIGDDVLPDSVPDSLYNVVSCLTYCETDDPSSNPPYKSAKEVVEDLEQMLIDPDSFLYELHKQSDKSPRLVCKPNKLYGRSEEVKTLLNAYDQMCSERNCNYNDSSISPGMVLIAGYGGSGKTTLTQCLKSPVIKDGGYFITGKFEDLQTNQPYSALISALADLCASILKRDDDTIESIRSNIVSAVGAEDIILTELIPNLSKIVNGFEKEIDQNDTQNNFTSGIKAQNKLHFFFRRFMRALATPEYPIVMVLDDLQWADTASLSLIQNIVTDSENKSPLLLVGCYRDDDLCDGHPLLVTIHEVERLKYTSSNKSIDRIKIDNLCKEDLNVMISDTLLIKRRVARNNLTDLVYKKTRGNALFSVQFLISLIEDKLLYFQESKRCWQWDKNGIQEKNVPDCVVDLLTQKIKTRLSDNARNILMIAACIGTIFEVHMLEMVVDSAASGVLRRTIDQVEYRSRRRSLIINDDDDDVSETLSHLVNEGLVDHVESKAEYRFVHDRIHQAAYSSIPTEASRQAVHHHIGELMLKMLYATNPQAKTYVGNKSLLFRMTDQLNRGSHLINDESKRISLAGFNLDVAEICMKKAAFQTAVTHLEAGIKLISEENCWQKEYNLVLRLHSLGAEAQYSSGNLNPIPKLLDKVFAHAKSFEDKVNCYFTQMLVLGSQSKTENAVMVGLNALSMMGEHFPTNISKHTIIIEMMKTKRVLKKKSDSLLELPLMVDKIKVVAMQFLGTIVMNCAVSKPQLVPLVVCRMIRLTISHGICEAAAFSLALFGNILCEKMGDIKEGCKYGQLALSILKRCNGKEWLAKVYTVVFSGINYWSKDHMLCTEPFLDGYKIGMEVGDIEYASMCAIMSVRESYLCGESLVIAERRAKMFCHQFAEYNQEKSLKMCVPLWQIMLDLLGDSDNLGEMNGKATEFERNCLKKSMSQEQEYFDAMKIPSEVVIAYLFGKNKLAAEKSRVALDLLSTTSGTFRPRLRYIFFFYHGLNAIDMASSTREKKLKAEARRSMKELRKAARKSPWNNDHMYLLLKAGCIMLKGKKKRAAKAYDAAIAAAVRTNICSNEALAYENAGIFFKQEGLGEKAAQCFVNAHQSYLKWGAQAKADHLYNKWMCGN